jgi:acetyl esterase/lipase
MENKNEENEVLNVGLDDIMRYKQIPYKSGDVVLLDEQDVMKHSFNPPVQIIEGLDVYRRLLETARYFIDPDKIAVMGDSSGGTMTAAVALLARDGMAPLPKGQMLLYPSLDMRYNTESMKKYTDVPVVNAEAIDCYRKIVRTDWSQENKYYLSPTQAESFEGLCNTYIETAQFDALHDEGVEYAKKLEAAGVPVILNETKGTVHSFDMAADSTILAKAMKKRIAFLKDIFK